MNLTGGIIYFDLYPDKQSFKEKPFVSSDSRIANSIAAAFPDTRTSLQLSGYGKHFRGSLTFLIGTVVVDFVVFHIFIFLQSGVTLCVPSHLCVLMV